MMMFEFYSGWGLPFRGFESFELAFDSRGDFPRWAERRMRPLLMKSMALSLRHKPIELMLHLDPIPKQRLLPPADRTLSSRLLPQAETLIATPKIGLIIGARPITEEWTKNDRYKMMIKCYDPVSALGLDAAYSHEHCHKYETVSFGGQQLLFGFEVNIAKYKPFNCGLSSLIKALNRSLKNLKTTRKTDIWKELPIQLETYPTLHQMSILSSKEYNKARLEEGSNIRKELLEFPRPEYEDLFLEITYKEFKSGREEHWKALKLIREYSKSNRWNILRMSCFLGYATHLGFVGRSVIRQLIGNIQKKYGANPRYNSILEALFELRDMTLEECRRIALRILRDAYSGTRGNIRSRLKTLTRMEYGDETCVLFMFHGNSYISRLENISDSVVEDYLSFYVDYSFALQAEKAVKLHLKFGKPVEKVLSCPLRGAFQPPWCPDCNGKLKIEIVKGIMNYEPLRGLNQRCPYIKEWLGQKKINL